MSVLEQKIRKNLKYNLLVNLVDGGMFGLGWGFGSMGTMLPLFVSRLTNSALIIGLIPALHGVAWQLPQLFLANKIARLRRYRPLVMLLTLHERVPFIGLALVAFFVAVLGPTAALVLTFLFLLWQGIGSGLTANPWQSMVAKIIPSDWRGTFFGLQGALANIFISITAVAAGFILDRMPDRIDFALCFLLAAVAMGLSMIFLGLTREPEDTEKSIPPRQVVPWRLWVRYLGNRSELHRLPGRAHAFQFCNDGLRFLYCLRAASIPDERVDCRLADSRLDRNPDDRKCANGLAGRPIRASFHAHCWFDRGVCQFFACLGSTKCRLVVPGIHIIRPDERGLLDNWHGNHNRVRY